jgi:Fe-S cluster assembly scaffold IscU
VLGVAFRIAQLLIYDDNEISLERLFVVVEIPSRESFPSPVVNRYFVHSDNTHIMRRALIRTPVLATLSATAMQQLRHKYSPKVEDHYRNPRNVGALDKNDPNVGSALEGAAECGDMVQLSLRVNPETTVIEEAKFRAFGCGSAIASASYVSEVLRGKTIDEALDITNKDIAAELSLPPVKLHCSMLAEETIRAAVANYLSKRPEIKSKVKRSAKVAPKEETKAAEVAAH